jgi:hypothetical protein
VIYQVQQPYYHLLSSMVQEEAARSSLSNAQAVQQAGAAMLVDVPVGVSPTGGTCSVTTVVIPDRGKGDRPVESSGVKVSVGWVKSPVRSAREASKSTGRSKSEPVKPRKAQPIGSG